MNCFGIEVIGFELLERNVSFMETNKIGGYMDSKMPLETRKSYCLVAVISFLIMGGIVLIYCLSALKADPGRAIVIATIFGVFFFGLTIHHLLNYYQLCKNGKLRRG